MRPVSLAKRSYILVTLLITTLTLILGYLESNDIRQQTLKQHELDLVKLVMQLEEYFPRSVEIALAKEDIQALSHREHIARFSPVLQAVLDEIGKQHPTYGIGYGGKQMLAAYPPKPEILELPLSELATRALSYKQLQVGYNPKTNMWDGAPTLSVVNPHLVNGEVVAFSWANVKLDHINQAFLAAFRRHIIGLGSLWIMMMLGMHYSFRRINRELQRFHVHLRNYKSGEQITAPAFSEMSATLDTVAELRFELLNQAKATADAQHRLHAILEQSPAGIIVVNRDGLIQMINNTLKSVLGENEQLIGSSYFDLIASTGLDPNASPLRWALAGTTTRNSRQQIKGRDWVLNATPLYQEEQIIGAVGIYQDITDLVQIEQERLEALERFQTVFSNSLAVMAIMQAPEMTYVDVNPAWEKTWGYTREEAIGKTPYDLGFSDCQVEGEKLVESRSDTTNPVEYIGHTKSGEKRTVLSQVTVIREEPKKHILYVLLDMTQIRQYEQEMAHLDRLNMVGEMAAGIGHEVRNPMTTVRGYLQLLQMKEEFTQYHTQFSTMIEEIDRANSIITEFLSLAKNKTVEMQPGNLNSVIRSIRPLLLADAFRRGHELCTKLGPIPDTEFDEKEIRQLILNLVRNGLEALDQKGEVVISTYQKGENIVLQVRDTGPGIAEEVLPKLGTPFVTTKDNGTGLGLPVCYRIADRHGAKIDVATGPDGTTFTVTFNATGSMAD